MKVCIYLLIENIPVCLLVLFLLTYEGDNEFQKSKEIAKQSFSLAKGMW